MRRRCAPPVAAWFSRVARDELFVGVVVLGEIRRGIERLRLRDTTSAENLDDWLETIVERFGRRIIPVDRPIADRWGRLSPRAPIADADGLIAATALHFDLVVGTRNLRDFERVPGFMLYRAT